MPAGPEEVRAEGKAGSCSVGAKKKCMYPPLSNFMLVMGLLF